MSLRNFANFALLLVFVTGVLSSVPWIYDIVAKISVVFVSVYLSQWLMTYTRKYFLHRNVSPLNKAVFITGCDSGFGQSLACRLDTLGYHVIAGCLDPAGAGARNLAAVSSSSLTVLPLDVTSETSVTAAVSQIRQSLRSQEKLWAVVNNAGIACGAELEWDSMRDIQRVHEVNLLGLVRVSKALLGLLRESGGRVVNVTSMCGKFICPGFIPYCMSKSAAIVFTKGLRIEMKRWGVKAISIEPFFYRTPLTKMETVVDIIDKNWQKVDPDLREIYGEKYKDTFIENTREVLRRSSPKVHEVIDCLEDAVTAEDPLPTYSPAYLPDKIGISLLQLLPPAIEEEYLRLQLERGMPSPSLSK